MMPRKNRIVVINDDPTQLHLISRILERFGYDVRTYIDAEVALNELVARPAVDLFLVDLHMPGIDGWKLCRLLRSPDFPAFNETPILIVSATFTGTDVEAITTDLGADAFLALPFSREELLEYVAELLEGNTPRTRTKVLIVEDDDAVRTAATRLFEANGFQVFGAATGAEADRLWARHETDVVLLDYHLPDAACEELLSRFRRPADPTVVLVMTGDTDPTLPADLLAQDPTPAGVMVVSASLDLAYQVTAPGIEGNASRGYLACSTTPCDPAHVASASPIAQVRADSSPAYIVAGAHDTYVPPPRHATAYVPVLRRAVVGRDAVAGQSSIWYDLVEDGGHNLENQLNTTELERRIDLVLVATWSG